MFRKRLHNFASILCLTFGLTLSCDFKSDYEKNLGKTNGSSCYDIVNSYRVPESIKDTSRIYQKFDSLRQASEDDQAFRILTSLNPGPIQDALIMNADTLYLFTFLYHKKFVNQTKAVKPEYDYNFFNDYSDLFLCQCYEMNANLKNSVYVSLYSQVRDAGILLNDSARRAKFILNNGWNENRQNRPFINRNKYYESLLEKIAKGDTILNDRILRNIVPYVSEPVNKFYYMNATSEYKNSVNRILPTHPVLRNMSDKTIMAIANRLLNGNELTKRVGENLLNDLNAGNHRK